MLWEFYETFRVVHGVSKPGLLKEANVFLTLPKKEFLLED
jgi:hypothetical protein